MKLTTEQALINLEAWTTMANEKLAEYLIGATK